MGTLLTHSSKSKVETISRFRLVLVFHALQLDTNATTPDKVLQLQRSINLLVSFSKSTSHSRHIHSNRCVVPLHPPSRCAVCGVSQHLADISNSPLHTAQTCSLLRLIPMTSTDPPQESDSRLACVSFPVLETPTR